MSSDKENADKEKELATQIVGDLLNFLDVKPEIVTEIDEASDDLIININVERDAGLLIGNRGKVLNSLQLIIGVILNNKFKKWRRVIIDVSGWRNQEKRRLESLAEVTAKRAEETGKPQYLYNLSSSQRRIIHLYLSENPRIKTESRGEGKERCLIISSKS